MGIGFTESKVDSNLYFKLEDGRPLILMLYVNDLFLIEKVELIKVARGGSFLGMEVW